MARDGKNGFVRKEHAGKRQNLRPRRRLQRTPHGNNLQFTEKELLEIRDYYCDKIAQGLPLRTLYHPKACWPTFCRLKKDYPEIFNDAVAKAKAERGQRLVSLGMGLATGKIDGSTRAWGMMMKNLVGWTEAGGVDVDDRDEITALYNEDMSEEEMARQRLRQAVRNGEQWATEYLLKKSPAQDPNDTTSSLVAFLRKIDGKTKDLTERDEDE